MTYTFILQQQQENVDIIDLTMDTSDDDYCSNSVIDKFTSRGSSYMELDEIECFRDEEKIVDLVDEFDDEPNFFDEEVTESDLQKGRYFFDVDNGFYRYNEHYSNNSDSERFFCYRDDDDEEEFFFEKDPENITCENYEDLCFTEEFSILSTTTNDFDLEGRTFVELD